MPKSEIYSEISGQKVKLTNLEKILYPDAQISKAEIIQYYLSNAEFLLRYIKNRPLTLIRFPDGIDKASFYAKTKPDWTPEWVDSFEIKHTNETIPYIVAHNDAVVAWIANLGGLEIHPMQFAKEQQNPDHFIFDLDPPENFDWQDIQDLAYELKAFFTEYDYHAFVKTSGSKGLHIYVPILPKFSYDEMIASVKSLAQEFVRRKGNLVTLRMNKEKRKGKMLLDIFRNHKGHTTVAPYSLRGKPGAPISMPILWKDLEGLSSSQHYHIKNYKEYMDVVGDAWENMFSYAQPLHDSKTSVPVSLPGDESKLDSYNKKRDFDLTSEPPATVIRGNDDEYVVQLHDASNLHHDLRLEVGGVLWSWAIPKGIPHSTRVKRMAIKTEDHPIKYLDYEGVIPKGEYGAGKMWVLSRGKYKWISKEEKKLKFELLGEGFKKTYSLYNTKDDQWLIERKDQSKELEFVSPMLVEQEKKVPSKSKYFFEIKWDGIRTIVIVKDDEIKIYSKSGRDLSAKFPELLKDRKKILISNGIFDGEIVCIDQEGRPEFSKVISRMHSSGEASIGKASKSNPVFCYLFDIINMDGKDVTAEPLEKRKEWLDSIIKANGHFRISELLEDGEALFQASRAMNLEGIMAKRKGSKYYIDQRSDQWLKIKFRNEADCFILGYTKGQGDRSALFGSMHLGQYDDVGNLIYKGRVGTGFDTKKMKFLLSKLNALKSVDKYIDEKVDKEKETTWLEPMLKCEIMYASMSSNDTFREPVFVKLKEKE